MPSLTAFSMRSVFGLVSTLALCIAHLYYSKLMFSAHLNHALKRLLAAHCKSNRECFCCKNGKARVDDLRRVENKLKSRKRSSQIRTTRSTNQREKYEVTYCYFLKIVLTAYRAMGNFDFSHYLYRITPFF